jgi:glycosyltransferase involved in cell wall biosynthesis
VRILHVTEASGSGVLGVVKTLTEGTSAAGHHVAVAFGTRPETPADLQAWPTRGADAFPLPWHERTPRAQLTAARALRRLVRDWEPDVVHLHSSFAGVVGAIVLGGRVPLVYTPHGYAFQRVSESRSRLLAYRAAEWLVARRVTLVGAVSEAEGELARTRIRAPRVAVVPNGIPELDFDEPSPPPERIDPLVVAMGRLDAARSPAASARILAAVADLTAVRWIGGGPSAAESTLRVANIEVTGWLPREQASSQLAGATACLHWSAWDGSPLAILEAMAHDVVVVASDIPPNRELLGPGQVVADEAEAVALLRAVLTDPQVRDALLERQRARRGRFSAQQMVAGWLALYERLAGGLSAHPSAQQGHATARA